MGIFDRFFQTELREKSDNRHPNHNFTDADRERAIEARENAEMKKALRQIKRERLEHLRAMIEEQNLQEEIDSLESQLFGREEEAEPQPAPMQQQSNSFDNIAGAIIASIAAPYLQKVIPLPEARAGIVTGTSSQLPAPPSRLTDDEIKAKILEIPPQYLKKAKGWKDETLYSYISRLKPEFDEETIKRGIQIFRAMDVEA